MLTKEAFILPEKLYVVFAMKPVPQWNGFIQKLHYAGDINLPMF